MDENALINLSDISSVSDGELIAVVNQVKGYNKAMLGLDNDIAFTLKSFNYIEEDEETEDDSIEL